MKKIQLLMLMMAALPFFVSCSDDDEVNTKECTVGFENEEFVIEETATGYTKIPITVSGHRNGPVKIIVEASPLDENGAVEGKHYMITDKTLNINADTLSSGTMNVEIKVIDDRDINEDRQFKLTIVSAQGAEISAKTTTIRIKDNDGDIYKSFVGTWIINAKQEVYDSEGHPIPGQYTDFSTEVNISGTTNENHPDYENILYAQAPGMFNVGVPLDCSWRFRFSFDMATKKGKIAFICGEIVATFDGGYQWIWVTDDGQYLTDDDITAEWSLDENNQVPETIKFPEGQFLYLYQPGAGFWDAIFDISITRK